MPCTPVTRVCVCVPLPRFSSFLFSLFFSLLSLSSLSLFSLSLNLSVPQPHHALEQDVALAQGAKRAVEELCAVHSLCCQALARGYQRVTKDRREGGGSSGCTWVIVTAAVART